MTSGNLAEEPIATDNDEACGVWAVLVTAFFCTTGRSLRGWTIQSSGRP